MLDVADLVPVPDRVDPIAPEPVLVNGLTRLRSTTTREDVLARVRALVEQGPSPSPCSRTCR